MKALITGSNGLLGTALKNRLGSGHVYLTRNDIELTGTDAAGKLNRIINENKIDTIINCAATVGGIMVNMENNYDFFNNNYIINNTVINAAYQNKIPNFVNILSTCIFPDNVRYPLTPEQIDNGSPHDSNYGYSYAKRLSYHQVSIIQKVLKNNWINVIPCNMFGVNDNFELHNSHLIPALIHKAYLSKKNNTDFIVWGSGKPLRQFIFADDLAECVLWAIKYWKKPIPFMAVNTKEYSIFEIATIIAGIFCIPNYRIKFDKTKPDGQYRKPAISHIPANLQQINIKKALKKVSEWFINRKTSVPLG